MSDNRQKLLNKIKALMAKTVENGCTEAEAMAALSMAQAMMDAYEVTLEDIKETEKESAIKETMKDMRDPHNIRGNLAVCISEFTSIKVWRSEYKSQKFRYNFVGLKSDIDFAVWLLEHLTMFVQKELKNYIWANGHTNLEPSAKRRVINGFVFGCCNRINAKFRELINQGKVNANNNDNALVLVKNELIVRKMNELNVELSKGRKRSSSIEPDGYAAGQAAGDRATFGRPVGSGSGQQLRLK